MPLQISLSRVLKSLNVPLVSDAMRLIQIQFRSKEELNLYQCPLILVALGCSFVVLAFLHLCESVFVRGSESDENLTCREPSYSIAGPNYARETS